ncbi:MAG: prepilin-type N-terminal cleavage/methylation domain-containing protein [Patescibacteria group bacterium]
MAGHAHKKGRGFTLLELLVVIGIIGILAAIVIVAINPGRQFAQARNAQRWNDVNALLNAIHQYAVDNQGLIPAGITTSPLYVANPVVAGDVDLCPQLVGTTGIYLTQMPVDPKDGTASTGCTNYTTKYSVVKDALTGRVTVSATGEEGVSIKVTR